MNIPLTLLYAPADRPERYEKALDSGAHTVIFDLEDAVAPGVKDEARSSLGRFFAGLRWRGSTYENSFGQQVGIQVRVNASDSKWHQLDVQLVRSLPSFVGVRLPKAETVDQVNKLAAVVGDRPIHLLLENALGVENAYHLARAHPQVAGLSLGEADLRSELGISGDKGLDYARSRAVYASRAAHLEAPVMAVFASVSDLDGLRASCEYGKSLGQMGRTAIHPRQLSVIEEVFSPTSQEVERAKIVLSALEGATMAGSGTAVLADGTFLDAAMVRLARRTIELSQTAQA